MTTTPHRKSRRRRRPGMNLLSGHQSTPEGESIAHCNMVSLTPFTRRITGNGIGDDGGNANNLSPNPPTTTTRMVRRGYESALAKLLALKHLHDGDDSIITELGGLPERCPVRFGLDFVETGLHIGTATIGLARRVSDVDHPPCLFLGSYRSIVSATTARATSEYGYPQVSGTSTSSYLDSTYHVHDGEDGVSNDHPLFSRTIPSTKGQADATIRYLANVSKVDRLSVLYIADPYGSHFYRDLKEAAEAYSLSSGEPAAAFVVEGFSVLPDLSNLSDAMEFVRSTGFSHVFVAIHGETLLDNTWMEEAMAHGLAATNKTENTREGITWIFGDEFLDNQKDSHWIFDQEDPLVNAYRGTGVLTANGRGNPDGKYHEFTKQLRALFRDKRTTTATKQKKHDNHANKHSGALQPYLETMVSDEDTKILAMEFLEELLADDTFLHPDLLNHAIPYEYEATIMAGLTICNRIEKEERQRKLNDVDADADLDADADADETDTIKDSGATISLEGLFIDGEEFQDELVHTSISGISGRVVLDPETGTRLSNSTYYTIENLEAEYFIGEGSNDGELVSKARLRRKKIAQLEPKITADENHCDDDDDGDILIGGNCNKIGTGEWVTFHNHNHLHNTIGSTNFSGLVLRPSMFEARVEQASSSMQKRISLNSERSVHITQGLFCGLPILAAMACIGWTYKYQNQPIVRASKPIFLYLICCGVISFAFSILPFSVMGNSNGDAEMIPENFERIMTVACSVSIWFRSLGFAVVVSALFTKVYRIHKIAKLYQATRHRVLIDFLVPLGITLTINILILCLMTALDPVKYGVVNIDRESRSLASDNNAYYYESCVFSEDQRHRFWIPLITWNISILAFALYKSWSIRNLDLEASPRFPAEGKQIFRALVGTLLVSLLGIPITLIVRDRNNPVAIDLVESLITFAFCNLVLVEVFATKMKYVWKISLEQRQQNIGTQNDGGQDSNDNNGNNSDRNDNGEDDNDEEKNEVSEHSKTKEELKAENAGLRRRNEALEEEVILYPSSGGSVNITVKRFFGNLLGSVSSFVDEVLQAPSTEMHTEEQQRQEQQRQEQQQLQQQQEQEQEQNIATSVPAAATVTATTRKPFKKLSCKKVYEDIDYSPPTSKTSSPSEDRTRIHLLDIYKPPWARSSVVTTRRSSREREERKSLYFASISNSLRNSSQSQSHHLRNSRSTGDQTLQKNSSSSVNFSISNISHIGSSSYLRSHNYPTSSSSSKNKKDSPESNDSSFWGNSRARPRGPEPDDNSSAPINNRKDIFRSVAAAEGAPRPPKPSGTSKTDKSGSIPEGKKDIFRSVAEVESAPRSPKPSGTSKTDKSSSIPEGREPRWSTDTVQSGDLPDRPKQSRSVVRPRPKSKKNGGSDSPDSDKIPLDIPRNVTVYSSYYWPDDLRPDLPPPPRRAASAVHPRYSSYYWPEDLGAEASLGTGPDTTQDLGFESLQSPLPERNASSRYPRQASMGFDEGVNPPASAPPPAPALTPDPAQAPARASSDPPSAYRHQV